MGAIDLVVVVQRSTGPHAGCAADPGLNERVEGVGVAVRLKWTAQIVL